MINRRTLVGATTVSITAAALGAVPAAAAQPDGSLPFRNASFISSPESGTPQASPIASPEPTEFRGYILGEPEAPNTLQIFADYRCPHCRAMEADIVPSIIEDYVKPGTLKIEFIDFTVIGVPSFEALVDDTIESVQAAEAAACAAEQNAYLQYRHWLFDGPLRTNEGDFSDDNLIAAADSLGLDLDLFADALLSGKYEASIIEGVSLGLDRGVQGTPAMTLNGGEPFYVPVNGYDGIKELLDEEMRS